MQVSELKNKEVLVLGFGREGQDSFLFLRKHFPDKRIGIADQKEFEELSPETQKLLNQDNKIVLYFGDGYLKQMNKYDVVVKSPGIPLDVLQPFLTKRRTLTSQTNIFFDNCPGTIVGVTGTKGKSTTSSLIYEVLKAGKIQATLVGNIEEPVLQFLDNATKDDVFVYELSSFQLELATRSPHIALFLNLYPEHLDHHKTFKAYAEAKANITKFQTENDFLIFNEMNGEVARIAAKSKAQLIPYAPTLEKNATYIAPLQPVFAVAKLFNIPKEKAQKTCKKFKPLPHRLEPVGTVNNITFYNDSLATIPEATMAALDLLGKNVHTLIAGGYDRGIDYSNLAKRICESDIKTIILFPTTGQIIWQEIDVLHPENPPREFFVNSMADAIEFAYKYTPKEKICLLSPASSSFNMFRDYKDRGEQFKKFIKAYAKKK